MKAIDGQSLLDISIQSCGSIEGAMDMAINNGLSLTEALNTVNELIIPSVLDEDIAGYFAAKAVRPTTFFDGTIAADLTPSSGDVNYSQLTISCRSNMQAVILDGQSLFDVAIEKCGSIESVFELAVLNGIGISEGIEAGAKIDLVSPSNKEIVNHFSGKGIKPATGITTTENNETIAQEGIEYWTIETDFVVS